jgi:hypothetical protein
MSKRAWEDARRTFMARPRATQGRQGMQAQTLTPSAIFGNHVRYVVPLFQRPYVWNKDEQ